MGLRYISVETPNPLAWYATRYPHGDPSWRQPPTVAAKALWEDLSQRIHPGATWRGGKRVGQVASRVHRAVMRFSATAAAAALTLTLSRIARADVAPAPEEECAETRSHYESCESCMASTLDGGTCNDVFADSEYSKVCALEEYGSNGLEYVEYCCANPIEQEEPSTSKDGGCTLDAAGRDAPLAALFMVDGLGGLAWLARRR
jgi:hypothetical protein